MSLFRKFWRSRQGNVAIIFAIAMIPLVGATGAAVDYARIFQVKTKLSDALDAGVLAIGRTPPVSQAAAFNGVNGWMGAHMGAIPYKLDSVTETADGLTGKASASVPMTLSRVLGVDQVTVSVTSQVLRTTGKVEIAFVLDNTGSMAGTKIATLIKAANKLVDSLSAQTRSPDDLRIALVPFSQTVNVGPTYQNAAWLDAAGKSASAKSLFLGQQVNRFDLFKKLGTSWTGCVETRPMPYETSEAYDPNDANSLYVPYFAPDEPGNKGDKTYNNSYLSDASLAAIQKNLNIGSIAPGNQWKYLQGDTLKYAAGQTSQKGTTSFGYAYGPNSGCEIAPLLRLTSNTATVKSAINSMIAQGNTDIPVGLTWGWNVLSPTGPFGDGHAYDDSQWNKVVVLMTDGNNENNEGNASDTSYYAGVGYTWQGRMGITSGSKAQRTAARDQRLAAICTAMKNDGKTAANPKDGVTIYTIRVEVKDGSSSVLQNCASDPDKFYDVQNVNQLVDVFQDIGGSIQKLRIAM